MSVNTAVSSVSSQSRLLWRNISNFLMSIVITGFQSRVANDYNTHYSICLRCPTQVGRVQLRCDGLISATGCSRATWRRGSLLKSSPSHGSSASVERPRQH